MGLFKKPQTEVFLKDALYPSQEVSDIRGVFEKMMSFVSELQVVPTSVVTEGPLEPGLTNSRSTDVPKDSSVPFQLTTTQNQFHCHIVTTLPPSQFHSTSPSPPPLMKQPSSVVPVSALKPPLNVQRNIGIPLLQPFPPPTPPPSLTPNSNSAPFYGPLTREKVRPNQC
ncbi:mRNA-decapping enzyme-like protein [Lactuca sativa]|uniref:mRNA-decapping enzyme-like protein n=1 Tax=Lactuca sativa TaxID=4236 RepID=UPI000CD8A9DB|nr:mRNA-decapping enzyme-like protein [Lactuca sativa]